MIRLGGGTGIHPLDVALGLTRDGFSPWVIQFVTRLATRMSFASSRLLCRSVLGWSPSVETIEELVLGLEPIRSKGDNATRSFATTITMTAEQLDAATTGEGVHFSQNGVEFVVIRFEVFDRVKELLQSDQRELRMILGRSSEGNGWDEPGMDAYDSCPEKP